jgi:hypothetical protein
MQDFAKTHSDHSNTSLESIMLGHKKWREQMILYLSVIWVGMMGHMTCQNMLQGIMIHPAFQFIPNAGTVKLYFPVWQIL